MGIYLLATSILIQLACVVIVGIIAWITVRRSWILITTAIILMVYHRMISLYNALALNRIIDPMAESVALLISLLMLVGFWTLFKRERAISAPSPGFKAKAATNNSASPGTIATLLGILIVLSVSVVAFLSFSISRNALIEDVFSSNLNMAQSLSTFSDSPDISFSSSKRIEIIENVWAKTPPRYEGSFVCIVNTAGNLLLHTKDRSATGQYVGDIEINDKAQRFSDVKGLAEAKQDWVGMFESKDGESQITAFSYSSKLDALVALHVPRKEVQQEILNEMLPLGAGLAFILTILVPAALGILYRAYSKTLRDVQSSEENFRQITETIHEVFWVGSSDWSEVLYVSPTYEDIWQRSCQSLYDNPQSWIDAIHEDDRKYIQLAIKKAYKERNSKTLLDSKFPEYRVIRPDGSMRWISARSYPVIDENGQVVRIIGIADDITARKWAENELRSSNRALFVLSECNQALVRATNEDDLLHSVCRTLVKEGEYRLAWVGFAEQNELKSVRPMAQMGFDEGYLDTLDITWADEQRGRGPTGSAIRMGRTVIARNILTDPEFAPWREKALEHGYASSIAIPLLDGEQAIGALNVYSSEPDAFNEKEEMLLLELADDITYGIITLRAREERQQAVKALREIKRFHERVLDDMTTFVAVLEPSGEIVFVNNTPLRVGGIKLEDVKGKKFFDTFWFASSYETQKAIKRDIEQCAGGESLKHDIRYQSADGTQRWAEFSMHPIFNEDGSVEFLIPEGIDITDRKLAQAELEQMMLAIEQVADTVIITDTQGTIQYVNPAFERTTGYTSDEAVGKTSRILKSGEHDEEFYNNLWETISRGETWSGRITNKRKDGKLIVEEETISPVRDIAGKTINFIGVKRDITKEIALENQLIQSQKMEAVGQLAGGIAHDFNNLLQVIMGFGEMAIEKSKKDDFVHTSLDEILKVSYKATTLVRQLLAFSRQQILEMKYVDLNKLITELMNMIKRVIGEHITLDVLSCQNLGIVRADPGQIEQILINLCVNARDAMPSGGEISIETENVEISEAYCETHTSAKPGQYVLLSVSDIGCGMDEMTQKNIFEPFFTTKAIGEGTGLGLSTVYGIVKQHEGMIEVFSEITQGTTFKIYLPLSEHFASKEEGRVQSPVTGGNETILLAEDDEMVRGMARLILESAGYTVLTAEDGEQALQVFEQHGAEINLVFLDVIMPKLGGYAVYQRIQQTQPEASILFASGYSMGAIHSNFQLPEGMQLIQKPYKRNDLLKWVRRVLDA